MAALHPFCDITTLYKISLQFCRLFISPELQLLSPSPAYLLIAVSSLLMECN